jgi:hypothetical protein
MTSAASDPTPGWRFPLAATLAAVLVQLPIFDRWYGLLDEGYMLSLAAEINRGRLLYRDVYVDAPFPAAFYVLAGWFRLLGTSVWAERLLAVGVFAVFVGATVRTAAFVLPRIGVAVVAVLLLCYRVWAFPHWQVYSYSSLAATLLAVATAVLAGGGPRPRLARVVAAGVLAGGAILSKQDYGVACTGALGFYLLVRWVPASAAAGGWRGGVRDGILFGAGAALLVVPVLLAIAAAGAWDAFVYQTVVSPLTSTGGDAYLPLPAWQPLFRQDGALRANIGSYLPAILVTVRWPAIAAGWAYRETALWDAGLKLLYHLPFVVWWTAAGWWTVRLLARRPPDRVRLLVFAWAGGLLLAFNTPRDWVHLMMVYPPVLLLGCVLAHDALGAAPRPARLALGTVGTIALAVLAADSVRLGGALRAAHQWPIATPRGGFYTDATHGPILADVLGMLDGVPAGVAVPVYPMQAMLGFLADRPAVAGYHVIWPFQPETRDARIVAELERQRTPAVVYSISQYAHLATFRQNAPRLFEYLVDHYELTSTFSREPVGPLLVGLTRDERAAGAVLPALVARLPAGGAAAAAIWPFARVLAVRVGREAEPVSAVVPFEVPADAARLAFVYGVNPERWLGVHDGPFVFTIAVDGTPAFRGVLDPARVLADRRWVAGAIDLAPYAGRTVRLAFEVRGPAAFAGDGDLAGWADFRVVPDADAAPAGGT